MLVIELNCGRQDFLLEMLVGLHVVFQHEFQHFSVPEVQDLFAQFGRLVDKVAEVPGLDDRIHLILGQG